MNTPVYIMGDDLSADGVTIPSVDGKKAGYSGSGLGVVEVVTVFEEK